MEFIYSEALDRPQQEGVWALVKAYGEDFVPPLSQRQSTCQQGLQGTDGPSGQGPLAYFEEMKHQRFVLAVEGEEIAGFQTNRMGEKCSCCFDAFSVSAFVSKQKTCSGLIAGAGFSTG